MDGTTVIDEITAKEGEQITTPDTYKDGYRFEGWYENAALEGNTVEIPSTMPAANKTYYAKYTRVYTIKFMYGDKVAKTIIDEAGAAVSYDIDLDELGLYNHDFFGWYDNADLEGETVDVVTTMPAENLTYYADIKEKATVRYYDLDQDNEYVPVAELTANKYVGDVITIANLTADDESILFLGWSTTKDGKASLKAGDTHKLTGSLTLYAQWASPFTNADYTGTLYVGTDGSVLYIDGANKYEGTAEVTPVADLEFTVNLGDGEKTGRVNADGTFELRNNDLAGFYNRYDWASNETSEGELYLGGYTKQGGSGANTFEYCLGVIAKADSEYIGMVIIGDEFYFFGNKITEDGYDEDDEYETSFILGDYDGEKFDAAAEGNYFCEAGEESRYSDIKDEQYGLWVIYLMDGSIGWPATGKLYDMGLFLDGYGYAEIVVLNGNNFVTYAAGTYAPGENYEDMFGEWVFTPDAEYASAIGSFTFKLMAIPANSGTTYLCWWEVLTYTNGNASIILKDGTNAIYTDANGKVKNGVYTSVGNDGDMVLFTETTSGESLCFILNDKTGAFEIAEAENGFIIKDGVVVTYVGSDNGTAENPLLVPASATEIAAYAFRGTDIKYIDLNNVTVINEGAFFRAYSLVCVIIGEDIEYIDFATFAYDNSTVSRAAFTVIFRGNVAPEVGTALFMNRANVTVELASVEALRSFWAEESWEDYISFLHFEQSGNDDYYGTYFNSSFTAVVEIAASTSINGVAGLFTIDNGTVSIIAYDKSQTNNCLETTGTLVDGVLTIGGDKYYKLAAGTELTFTADDESTLSFTFPGTAEFAVTATYTPADGEAEEVALYVEFGDDGIEVVFVRGRMYTYSATLNYDPEGQNTFAYEYEITKIGYISYKTLTGGSSADFDIFYMVLPYYGSGIVAEGSFESIKDATGNTLTFSNAAISYLGDDEDGYDYYAITFKHTDGYYYYLQLQTGVYQGYNVFFVGWYRANVKTFTDGDFTVEVYLFNSGSFTGYEAGDLVGCALLENGEPVEIVGSQSVNATTMLVLTGDQSIYIIAITVDEDGSVTGTVTPYQV